ncbi:unnamed protein product [Vitrella brassicaformis CCMP3155]|uniref:Peptidylprolyl isomerase n=1 Tax=Vitrella brassicaformis (strain CCMP3155) TaxID=1169540 RepID=A0A0G4F2C8_VITBC|nr:unnamed protein product [Vitrella brassicaformis CCMP3155]|eukprot:CEM05786.1 unnamed protein product [Vitrella brassicaformis CCMP3155]
MVVWLFAVLMVPWAAVDGFVRPPLTPLRSQIQLTSRLNLFQRISELRGRRCVAVMSGEPVGLLDGHFVYGNVKGGYEFEVNGQRLAIKPSFYSHIKFCIEHDKSAVDIDQGQENKEGDQPPAPAPTPAARPAADEGAAAGKDDNTADDGFVQRPSGALHKVVRQGSGRAPTANDRVKYDVIEWRDGFDGQFIYYDHRGVVARVSDERDWWREAVLSMREGEIRQIKVPDGYRGWYRQLRLIGIMDEETPVSFRQMPSGAYYLIEVVQPGSGPKPTGDQRVKFDWIQWADDFDGDNVCVRRGEVDRPCARGLWQHEVLTDMRVGEVRRVIVPTPFSTTDKDAYNELRLLDILTPAGFTRMPSGAYYQVVKEGSGPEPTYEQNVTVDIIEWRDNFDGQDKEYDLGGVVGRVSYWAEWEQEVLTDMRVGEVRRVFVPGNGNFKERYLEYRLVDIRSSVGSERPPPPPPPSAAAAAAPPALAREEAAASDGSRRRSTGVLSWVVQEGSGPTPTRDQRIKADIIEWSDDFDGQDKRGEGSGLEFGLSDVREWLQEMWTDMRVGEVRRVILPASFSTTGKDAYIEMRLLDII